MLAPGAEHVIAFLDGDNEVTSRVKLISSRAHRGEQRAAPQLSVVESGVCGRTRMRVSMWREAARIAASGELVT